MIAFLLSRAAYYLSIFLGIVVLTFVLFHMVPKDPARTILGANAEQSQVDQLREKLGLNNPLHRQFANYLSSVADLDFGTSYVDGRNVFQEVSQRLILTLALVGLSFTITFLYVMAVVAAFLRPRLLKLTDWLDFLMSSLPVFFSGILVAMGVFWVSPVTTFSGSLGNVSDWLYLLAPALVLAFYPMAILSGIVKQELTRILESTFVQAHQAWGFSSQSIVFVYAFKNALIPLLSAISNILPMLLTGAFIVEIIFSLPGLGSLLISSIMEQDFPMLECTVIVNGAFFVVLNFIFELVYPQVDPRIMRRSRA